MLLIASKLCAVCLLVCVVLGRPLIAQTASESDAHESVGAGTPSRKADRTDEAPRASDASRDQEAHETRQGLLIDSKPDFLDTFVATRHGKRIIGGLAVAIGLVFLLARQHLGCGNERCLKSERTVKKYQTVIRRDTLLLGGSLALMLGTLYLVLSIFQG